MTIKEKVKEVRPDCIDDRYGCGVHGCPRYYEFLVGHYSERCYGVSCNDCWNQEYIEHIEHDGCKDCKYDDMLESDEPCVHCKNTVSPNNAEYRTRPDLYEPKQDNVNHPPHYQGKHECIEEMIALFGVEAVKHFCMCNVYKYRYRASAKGGQEDLNKADWYMDKLMELTNKNLER